MDTQSSVRRILNVGGGSKTVPLRGPFETFQQVLLDIDPTVSPDIVGDGRELDKLAPEQFDAVYCSHNLEHYYRHDVRKVLAGFLHVLKPGGFAFILVPNIMGLLRDAIDRNLDIDDVSYESGAGPIKVVDIIYGYSTEIELSGVDFYAHKTGFTSQSLAVALNTAGFSSTYKGESHFELSAIAFKGNANPEFVTLFGLPTPPARPT